MPFYNCHIHIFSAQCAPKRFLQVGLPKALNPFSSFIKNILETRPGRWVSHKLGKFNWGPFKVAARYASFASVGTMSSQQMVFENILQYYPTGSRFVVLSLNMDFMGAGPSELTYEGQVNQIIQLRRLYPDSCLPFLSVDPRMGTENDIFAFVEKYVGRDLAFVGIKLYPALGYFPFDQRLEKVYAFCEIHEIPIMTHCTRSGAYFLGKLNAIMGVPPAINFTDASGQVHTPSVSLPHDFSLSNNNENCDIFLQPENWSTVLAKYPKLKVCFAHMGGMGEIFRKPGAGNKASWYEDIKSLMVTYGNVYTDVSYTLSDKRCWTEIQNFLEGKLAASIIPWRHAYGKPAAFANTLQNRLLFGTDYFMTEQEDSESNLASKLPHWLIKQNAPLYNQLTEQNSVNYLSSLVYKPA